MPVNQDDFNGLVSESLKTTSRIIAEKFGKMHKDVLRAIRNLECSEDFNQRNFAPVEYVDAKGEARTEYGVTRDGFTFLVMGFTGKEAAAWKEKFIAAFNMMEDRIKRTAVLTGPQLLAAALIEADATMKSQAARIEMMQPKVDAFDRLDAVDGALSVRPAAKVRGVPEHKLIKWLQLNRWAFRQNGQGPLQAYVDKRNCGYLDHKLGEYTGRDGDQRISITLMITPKGMARLAQIFAKEGGAA